jgi:hypothetical protein
MHFPGLNYDPNFSYFSFFPFLKLLLLLKFEFEELFFNKKSFVLLLSELVLLLIKAILLLLKVLYFYFVIS